MVVKAVPIVGDGKSKNKGAPLAVALSKIAYEISLSQAPELNVTLISKPAGALNVSTAADPLNANSTEGISTAPLKLTTTDAPFHPSP